MKNKAYDEAIRYQAIAAERAQYIKDLETDMDVIKLEHSIQLMKAANEISRLRYELSLRT